MKERKRFIAGLISGVAVCLALSLAAGVFAALRGWRPPGAGAFNFGLSPEGGSPEDKIPARWDVLPEGAVTKINEIYKILDKHYVDGYDKSETLDSLYAGLVYGIGDPYTVYMNEASFNSFMQDTEGSFAGIGIVVSIDDIDNRIVVVSPFEGCPGARAGILAKDKIVRVNGYDVNGDNMDEAVSMMKGAPGTSVTVSVYRESARQEMEFTIIRENIEVPTITHRDIGGGVGYIRVSQFSRVTDAQFALALSELKAAGMRGLIVDLRNNPGGLLDVVCNIADMLLPEGTIVYTEDKNGRRVTTKSDAGALNMPLILLVNNGSASASEVLSGAVKDLGVGELLGERTFGKGLVQNIYKLSDGSAVKVTIAKYYTPSGVCIQGEGIAPDYEVDMADEMYSNLSELTLEQDIQLKRAADILRGKF
jgi:carboxyl-terminal processing protease